MDLGVCLHLVPWCRQICTPVFYFRSFRRSNSPVFYLINLNLPDSTRRSSAFPTHCCLLCVAVPPLYFFLTLTFRCCSPRSLGPFFAVSLRQSLQSRTRHFANSAACHLERSPTAFPVCFPLLPWAGQTIRIIPLRPVSDDTRRRKWLQGTQPAHNKYSLIECLKFRFIWINKYLSMSSSCKSLLIITLAAGRASSMRGHDFKTQFIQGNSMQTQPRLAPSGARMTGRLAFRVAAVYWLLVPVHTEWRLNLF